ncbi:MAG: ankyrin repeat domain-containing protein [Gammaproteobacteria bacterium]|nr:ankyrin repeat domain-containing protein [Gammaproteobacteria bacterium]
MKTDDFQAQRTLAKVLKRELSPATVGEDGWTDLHFAAVMGLSDDCRALVGQGVPVDARLKDDGQSLSAGLMRTLRDLSLEFTTWEREGDAPLHLAAWANAPATAAALLGCGANVNGKLASGATPLSVAARFDSAATAEVLLANGADVQVREFFRYTPLHTAAFQRSLATAKLLVDAGADIAARGHDNWTPLHVAALFDATDVARLLLDCGADINAVSEADGGTPLDFAEARSCNATAAMLRRRGGDITVEERTEMIGVIDTKLGGGWGVMQPIYRRTKKRRPPRRPRAVG